MKNCVTLELHGELRSGGVCPFFWKLAAESGLTGWITSSNGSVFLRIEGTDRQISEFIRSLPATVPGAFRLRSVNMMKREVGVPDEKCQPSFRVLDLGETVPEIRPDFIPCPDCVREALDRNSRRYCHPFFSCALCGPQYSFALRSPFARHNTSLTAFPMCQECRAEKEHGESRLRGSELLSCPKCGPQFFLLDKYGDLVTSDNPLCLGREALKNGEILAMQSLYGGFQLFADAFNPDTVQRLRRKRKLPNRPFCVMARDLETVRRFFVCSEAEADLLKSPAAPVVILKKLPGSPLPEVLSPDTDTLAVGLPPSLPEKLLFEHQPDGSLPQPFELLATCGDNRPGKAECLDIEEVFNRLKTFTDKFLCHDLKTGHACPASICEVSGGEVIFSRRARGYVPGGIRLAEKVRRTVGAFGCDIQAAVALGVQNRIIPSQALGALEGEAEATVLRDMFERFTYLFDRVPDIMACDMDRDSFSARLCADFAELHGLPVMTVQTHHAHALACMAEHGLDRALALVMNAGSPGPDGTEWGSECLDARLDGFSRLAAFRPDFQGKRRPARLFLDHLIRHHSEASPELLARLGVDSSEYELWKNQRRPQPGQTHSALRLINAVCAGIGIAPDFCTYRDRCLLLLRKYAARFDSRQKIPESISVRFPFKCIEENGFRQIDWTDTMLSLASLGTVPEEEKVFYAEAFYRALAESMLAMALFAESRTGIRKIVLSGSLFLDPILREKTRAKLEANSFKVYTHQVLPCDESCVPAGQAYAAGLTPES